MSNPRNSSESLARKVSRLAALSGAVLGFGLIVGLMPASAAPIPHPGLSASGPAVVDAGYRRALKRQQFYNGYYVTDYDVWGPSYRVYRTIPGGNNEIRELQRLFPETNWPPSLRY